MFMLREHSLPTKESRDLIEEYSNELIHQQINPEHFKEYLDGHKTRLGFDLDYAAMFFKKDQNILEVGGLPFFVTIPLMKKYNVTTIDKITKEFAPNIVAKYGIKTLNCDLDYDTLPTIDDNFDGIIMNEVFEHLRVNLIFTMKEILRVLRPGGTLLLSTPNLRSIRGLYNILFRGEAFSCMGGIYENYSYLEKIDMMGHTREYTPNEVIDFLRKIGFEIDGIIYRGCYSGSRAAKYFTRVWPQFKPFFSVVARKPT